MKKILIGLLALSTLTAFADCDIKISGNMKRDRLQHVKNILTEKGYNVTNDAISYDLYVYGFAGVSQECESMRLVRASLTDIRQKKSVYQEKSENCGLFVAKKWNKRISTVLEDLPVCKN